MASYPPTSGQQRILQLLCRVTYVLRTTPSGSFAVVYTITARGSGHLIQTLTSKMVTSLIVAGWIEREPGHPREATVWTYRVTPAGVATANAPRNGGAENNLAVMCCLTAVGGCSHLTVG